MEFEGISYSRVGPMDPRQLRAEVAEEIAPSPTAGPAEPARHRQRRRFRRLRTRAVRFRHGGRQQ